MRLLEGPYVLFLIMLWLWKFLKEKQFGLKHLKFSIEGLSECGVECV